MRLATMLTAGSERSIKPKECKVSSNAEVMTVTSSGENAPSPKSDRIGMSETPPASRSSYYHSSRERVMLFASDAYFLYGFGQTNSA
jgi:hypothetical protein